jgi:hypothetical protein
MELDVSLVVVPRCRALVGDLIVPSQFAADGTAVHPESQLQVGLAANTTMRPPSWVREPSSPPRHLRVRRKPCAPASNGVRLLISEAVQTIANAPPVEVLTSDMKSVLERTLRWMRGHPLGQRGHGFVIAVKVLLAVIKVGISSNITSLHLSL